jgi:hypothetical protein
MIFPVWTLKYIQSTFGVEYDQRMIIKFLWNEKTNASKIATRLQAQFSEHAYQLRTVQFWITEIRRGHQDLYDEICSGRPTLDDLDGKIFDILDKSSFKSAHSIAERLLVVHSTVLQYLHESLGFKSFHLHWIAHLLTCDLREERKEYARSMLPFLHIAERDGWRHLVTDNESCFSLIHHHVACGRYREMIWSQNRDLIFRAKIHVYNHMESQRLLCCRQTPKSY